MITGHPLVLGFAAFMWLLFLIFFIAAMNLLSSELERYERKEERRANRHCERGKQ